jgi:predicted nucleic-acid-binding protein
VTGIDTNVVLRYMLDDSPAECRRVERFLLGLMATGQRAFVCLPVVQECAWVLTGSRLRRSKRQAAASLSDLLRADVFAVEQPLAVEKALSDWLTGSASFSDYLIGRLNEAHGHGPTFTLERGSLKRHPAFRAIPG